MLKPYTLSLLAITALTTSAWVHAGNGQVLVSAFAADPPAGASFVKHDDSSPASNSPFASRSVEAIAGGATASATAEADALTGAARLKIKAAVGTRGSGTGSGATAASSLDGGITLAGPATPGLATFTAELDGLFAVTGRDPSDSSADVHYEFIVGNSPQANGDLHYVSGDSGSFNVPFTWTQSVQDGDFIPFVLFFRADARTISGASMIDALNTFKITAVDLPPGFSFTSDAGGFLSQFGAPPSAVPEPTAAALLGCGLLALARLRRRSRRQTPTATAK